MKWIVGIGALLIAVAFACGGKILIPPPEDETVSEGDTDTSTGGDADNHEEEVVPGDEEGNAGGDSDTSVGDSDPGDSVVDGEGDADVGSDSDSESDTDEVDDCTGNCCNHPQPDNECDENHKISICHKGKHLCVDTHAVDMHIEHGDDLGNCEE